MRTKGMTEEKIAGNLLVLQCLALAQGHAHGRRV